ncbi:MAG: hypothetical protein ACOYIO_00205 [Eubacteriales bacterium]|jgi:hypothetical protein
MADNYQEIMNNLWKTGVIRRKLFHKHGEQHNSDDYGLLTPGEYIAIVETCAYEDSWECMQIAHTGFKIVKVISAKKYSIWSGTGSAIVEYGDGTRDKLTYFFGRKDDAYHWLEAYSFADLTHLKKCMEFRKQYEEYLRKKRIEEENNRYHMELQQRQREEALRRRNNSVSAGELEQLFRK